MSEKDYLWKQLRTMANLYNAWLTVRQNSIHSKQKGTQEKLKEISKNPLRFIRTIQGELRSNNYKFAASTGVTIKDRPLVISPIKDRIVRRAVLNILQLTDNNISSYLGEIPSILQKRTTIGGIPKKNVEKGFNIIKELIQTEKAEYYIKSDIKSFFTKINRTTLKEYILQQIKDEKFAVFFMNSLETELENEKEMSSQDKEKFPLGEIGVPQGSSLSAFASNIALRDFDKKMNDRGIITIRYIDDFIILGKNQKNVSKAFISAKEFLKGIGMEVYDFKDSDQKFSKGYIKQGFKFLGCFQNLGDCSPSPENQKELIKGCEKVLESLKGKTKILNQNCSVSKVSRIQKEAFLSLREFLSKIDKKIKGWGDHFEFCLNEKKCEALDKKIDKIVMCAFKHCIKALQIEQKFVIKSSDFSRRLLGVTLLKDVINCNKENK